MSFFKGTCAALKRFFRVVGDLSGNGLKALIHLTKCANRGVEAVFAHSLKLFTIL